ncbi:MAG: tetratricopeptide repeat protein [Verrucomicrobiales bacterium]
MKRLLGISTLKPAFALGMIALVGALASPTSSAQENVPNDQQIVDQASSYSLEKLEELLGVYDRLGKRQVTKALADEILKRDPENADALAVKAGRPVTLDVNPEEGSGSDGPVDRLAIQVESLQRQGRFRELASLLESAKKNSSGTFVFQEDLADAYYESGNIGVAKSAYREMVNAPGYSSSQRAAGRNALRDIESMERLAKAHELSLAGSHAEAIAIVEDMKKDHGGGNFPYEVDLGDVLFSSGDLDGAEAAYQSVVDGRGYNSQQRGAARTGLRDIEKGRRLLEAHDHLTQRRLDEATTIADELEAAGWRDDEDVQLLRAGILVGQGSHGDAIEILTDIKEKKYQSAPFPSQTDLADAYYQSNRLREARAAYAEIVDGDYLILDQESAAIDLRDLNREVNGSINFDLLFADEDEGKTWSSSLVAKSPIYENGLRLWAFADYDDLELSGDRSLQADQSNRLQGGFAIEKFIDENLTVAGYIGGSHSDLSDSDQFLFGGSFAKRIGRGKWGMKFAYNERAIDSITLQMLDGRQHRVELNLETPVGRRWYLDGFLYYRQIEALNDDIGDGYGGQIDFLYTVRESDRRRPAIRVGYSGEIHMFDSKQLSARKFGPYLSSDFSAEDAENYAYDLVEKEINLHGLRVVVEGRVSDKISYFLSGAAQYDFYDEEMQYSAGAGLELYVSDRTRLTTGVEYYSAGQTTSSGSGVILATVGVSIAF